MRILVTALFAAVFSLAAWSASATIFEPYTSQAFQSALESGKPVVVHVHADWCPVCRRQMPILDELVREPELSGVAAFRINFDLDRRIVEQLNVRTQATVLVIRNGTVTAASSYQTDRDALRGEILGGL